MYDKSSEAIYQCKNAKVHKICEHKLNKANSIISHNKGIKNVEIINIFINCQFFNCANKQFGNFFLSESFFLKN